ncbi:MAG: hypothetical protein KDC26_13035, partial [Armatimonadetes bacterium]|nr:hypothetical protein [Armatimonadota bacterium]
HQASGPHPQTHTNPPRPLPQKPLIQKSAKQGDSDVVQLSRLGQFVKQQEKLQTAVKKNPERYENQYTTAGFEHEFAQMVDDKKNPSPLAGVSHAEVAHSQNKMPYTGMSFILETDASNALELVSPPFLVKTMSGRPVPEPDEVQEIDEIFKERLGTLASQGPTMNSLISSLKSDGIRFKLKKIKVGSESMTPKTTKLRSWWNNKVKKNELGNIKLKPIEKSSGVTAEGILTHVNFATDFENYRLMEEAYTGKTDTWRVSYEGIETFLLNEMNETSLAEEPAPELDSQTLLAIDNALSAAKTVKSKIKDAIEAADSGDLLRSILINKVIERHDKRPKEIIEAIIAELAGKRMNSQKLMILLEAYRSPGSLTEDLIAVIRGGEQYRMETSQEEVDALGDEKVQAKLGDVTQAMSTLVQALDGLPLTGKMSNMQQFLHALARTLSSQVAVPALETLRGAQTRRYLSKTSKALENLTYEPHITSRLKDVREVWIKDTIQNIGLGLLSTKEWEKVRALAKNSTLHERIKSSLPSFKYPTGAYSTETLSKDLYSPYVIRALNDFGDQIQSHKLGQTDKRGKPKVDTSKTFIGPKKQVSLFSHIRKWIGGRQDTFIPAQKVQMPLWKDKRLHVVESRNYTVDTLKRLKAYHHGMARRGAPKYAPPPIPKQQESRSSFSEEPQPMVGRSRSVSMSGWSDSSESSQSTESFIPGPPSAKVAKIRSKLDKLVGGSKVKAINGFIDRVIVSHIPPTQLVSLMTDEIYTKLEIEGANYSLAADYIFAELQHRGYSFLG